MSESQYGQQSKWIDIAGKPFELRRFGGRARDAILTAEHDHEKEPYYRTSVMVAYGLHARPTDEQIDEIYSEWDPDAFVNPLAVEIMDHNGMGPDAEAQAEGNSDGV